MLEHRFYGGLNILTLWPLAGPSFFQQSASIKDEGNAMIAQPAVMGLYAISCVARIF
jgi:hypothetical protein